MKAILTLLFALPIILLGQHPVKNYQQFISAIDEGIDVALRLETTTNDLGLDVRNTSYLEVMLLDNQQAFLLHQTFTTSVGTGMNAGSGKAMYDPLSSGEGVAYVCLCQQDDLLLVLNRWKDGQSRYSDYEKFDCKYRNFSDKKEMYHGASFWKEIKPYMMNEVGKGATEHASDGLLTSTHQLTRTGDSGKKMDIVVDLEEVTAFKIVQSKSYLTKWTDDNGRSILPEPNPLNGWKDLFTPWKDYQVKQFGFWAEEKQEIPFTKIDQSFYSDKGTNLLEHYAYEGVLTVLVEHEKDTKQKALKNLTIQKSGLYQNGEVYLDFGFFMDYRLSGLFSESEKVSLSLEADIPLHEVTILDSRTGKVLAKKATKPYDFDIPKQIENINVLVTYSSLIPVSYKYSGKQ